MDPLTHAASAAAPVRLAPSQSIDLAVLLRDGQTVAGEVLETFGGGSIVLKIGGQRIPAESHVDLRPGARFVATAETADGELVLRLMSDDSDSTSRLLGALRSVAGRELSVAQIFESLSVALGKFAGAADGEGSYLAALLGDRSKYAFQPDSGGGVLRDVLLSSGLRYESSVRAAIDVDRNSAWLRTVVARDVVRRWIASHVAAGSSKAQESSSSLDERAIVEWLQGALEEFAAKDMAARGAWSSSELERWLARHFAQRSDRISIASHGVIERALAANRATPQRPSDAAVLLWLFGLRSDRTASAAVATIARAALRDDLKARLLEARLAAPEGPVRTAIDDALADVEAEQLVNLARQRFEEAWHFSIPVGDGERWTSAQFLHSPPHRDAPEADAADERSSVRFSVGVSFSRLGPIRADLLLRPESLLVALSVQDPLTAALLEACIEALRTDFAIAGRAVQIAVHTDPRVDAKLPSVTADLGFLNDRHLMDVRA